jgi:hypothetical protein
MAGNLFIVLATQVRAEWLCLIAALLLQSILTGKFKRMLLIGGSVTILLGIGLVTDISIPSPVGRGVKFVSAREIVARAVSVVDKDTAKEFSRKNTDFYAGTVSWRQRWWRAIWDSTYTDTETALLGHGYGYPLDKLVNYLLNMNLNLRTPHNVFFYALGYTGWIGVLLFFGFQAVIGVTLLRVWALTRQPFGIIFWLSGIIGSLFGDFFEAPQGAIPYYLMIGMVAASLVSRRAGSELWVSRAGKRLNSLPPVRLIGLRNA